MTGMLAEFTEGLRKTCVAMLLQMCCQLQEVIQRNGGHTKLILSGFGGLGVSVLASSTQVRGFKSGQSRRIFKGKKILSTPSFGGEVKPPVPCRRFAACKNSLNVAWKSTFRQNYQTILAHRVPPFAVSGLSHCADVGGTW